MWSNIPLVDNIETIRIQSLEISLQHTQVEQTYDVALLAAKALGFKLEVIITPN